jgi:biopolymer transport protein ExbB
MKKTIQALACLAFFLLPLSAFGAEPAAGETQNMLSVYKEGGFVMHILLVCSIAIVWLTLDVWMRTNRKGMLPEEDVAAAQQAFRAGDYVGAYQAMKACISPFSNVVRGGLSSIGYGKDAVEEAVSAEVEKFNATIQTRINYLSVIGVCAPMIGLLGTVVGMKGAFGALGTAGAGNAGELAGHIGHVLVATAAGLFVAIPAFMAFYFLRNKLQGSVHVLEEEVERLFRNAPYEYLENADVGQEETYAALPNWIEAPAG